MSKFTDLIQTNNQKPSFSVLSAINGNYYNSIPKPKPEFYASSMLNGFANYADNMEEKILSSRSRKRSRYAMLMSLSENCATRRWNPSTNSVDSNLPCLDTASLAPFLAFEEGKKISKASSKSKHDPSPQAMANSAIQASRLYGFVDDLTSLKDNENSSFDELNVMVDPSTPNKDILDYIKYLSDRKIESTIDKLTKSRKLKKFKDNPVNDEVDREIEKWKSLTNKFSESALLAIGVVVEELVSDMMASWAVDGHPLSLPVDRDGDGDVDKEGVRVRECVESICRMQLQGCNPHKVSKSLLLNRVGILLYPSAAEAGMDSNEEVIAQHVENYLRMAREEFDKNLKNTSKSKS